jgi:hypothetical protein
MVWPVSSLYRYTPGPAGMFFSLASSVGFIGFYNSTDLAAEPR